MTEHFTAWITSDTSALPGANMDVVVLADEIGGYTGETEEAPVWTSTTEQVFYAETGVDARDGEWDDARREAEALLRAAGWAPAEPWDAVDTGAVAAVERI